MPGVAIEFDLAALSEMGERIAALGNFDRKALLNDLAGVVESQVRTRISDEKAAPDGTPWPEWSESYAKTRHGGQSLLEGGGDLLGSIQSEVDSDKALIGSPLVYFAIHNFGGEELDIPIPARQSLGFNDDNMEELLEVTDDFLTNHLAQLN